MKSTVIRFYVAFSLGVLIGLSVQVAWRVQHTRTQTLNQAVKQFDGLSHHAARIWQTQPLGNTAALIRPLVHSDTSVLFFSVYGYEQGIDYLWARADRFIPPGGGTESLEEARFVPLKQRRFVRSFVKE